MVSDHHTLAHQYVAPATRLEIAAAGPLNREVVVRELARADRFVARPAELAEAPAMLRVIQAASRTGPPWRPTPLRSSTYSGI